MKRNNVKNKTETIISTGVIFILIGFGYVLYLLNSLSQDVQEKKQELVDLNILISKNQDSLSFIDQRLRLKQTVLDSIVKEINKSNDIALREKVQQGLQIEQTLHNSLKTKVMGANVGQVVYMQVGDKETKEYLENIYLLDTLHQNEYKAFGYDLQPERTDNTVRYFHLEDSLKAQSLKNRIEKATGIPVQEQYIQGFEKEVPNQQLEVWLKKAKKDSIYP
ncbi:hypothetical protein [Aquimarina algicola]|uniref:Uncharacterized protein n=1 Tax=Aquimarina algicola TaxID=2589995 RepID=A0A504J1L9_9FLAO|nr:hypothetical protein [Aquimarina algicola]TPN82382.1 hypothetical protein FHK87_23465 [Aquimarina algicola]